MPAILLVNAEPAGSNILTGVLILLERGRIAGTLDVPAQASSCREESPGQSLEVPKMWLQKDRLCSSCREAGGKKLNYATRFWRSLGKRKTGGQMLN